MKQNFLIFQEKLTLTMFFLNVILVMDNAPIHKTFQVKIFLVEIGVITVYLPSYSLDLNSIKNFFKAQEPVKGKLYQIMLLNHWKVLK